MSAMSFDPAKVRALAEILADTGLTEIEIETKEGRVRVARTPAPVSYTHLDVYKRQALRQGTLPADGPSCHRAVGLRPRPVAGTAPVPADVPMPALAAPERPVPQRHTVIRPGTDTPGLRPRAGQRLRPSRSASRWAFRDACQHLSLIHI